MTKCKIRKHMTINQHRGKKVMVFHYTCTTHGDSGSFLGPDNREDSIKLHKKASEHG